MLFSLILRLSKNEQKVFQQTARWRGKLPYPPLTDGPDHSFIATTQATESGAIDLISRWALEKPAALTVATMV